jgi:hypothetical protein
VSYKFRKDHRDPETSEIQKEIADNFISVDKNGDIVIDRDIHCRSLYVEGASLYIGGVKVTKPRDADADGFWKYNPKSKAMVFTKSVIEGSEGKVDNTDGTIADVVEKFNELKSKLENLGLIEK